MIYFLRSLDCLSSFAARGNEDFISVAKVVGYSLAVAKGTFITYILGAGQVHFSSVVLHLRFVKYFKRFDFRLADFD